MVGKGSAAADSERRGPITVVLVDDQPRLRATQARMLVEGGLELVGEAANGLSAIALVLDVHPDVVLIDLRLSDISGIQAIECLSRLAPSSRILVLTSSEQEQVVDAIVAGASGYILKSAKRETIASAVRATAAGEAVLSARIAGKLLERIREHEHSVALAGRQDASAIRAALTKRELEIFKRLASGHTDKEIAAELTLSASTVSNYVASILVKLHLNNRVEAAVQAVRSGIS